MRGTLKMPGSTSDYVDRLVHDDELHDNLHNAFDAARNVFERLRGESGVTVVAGKLAGDKKLRREVQELVDEIRVAGERFQGKKDSHKLRNLLVLGAGAVGVWVLLRQLDDSAS